MAIKKTLTGAVPSVLDGKVVFWNLTMKYEEGTEGEADYYTNDKTVNINAVDKDPDGKDINNFTPKAEADWTKKELEDLCPTTKWDEIFASQYDSVITNPPKEPVPDNSYVIPS
jgi:hypothetical protein|tara:strand:- start:45 stop:386 length:342 start_codon:yes stop_codon:yes gene_type:complete